MMKTLFFLVLWSSSAFAADWLCTEEASQRKGSSFYACGIGYGSDEAEARTRALDNAKQEFAKVCELSDDCRGHAVSAAPQRTACEPGMPVKCYRLMVFSVSDKKVAGLGIATYTAPETTFYPPVQVIAQPKPNAKIVVGMSKRALIQQFGPPVSVARLLEGELSFMFSGGACQYNYCMVTLGRGRVVSFSDFKPIYTGDLE